MLPNVGTWEMIIIVLVIFLVFGANKLPEITRGIGKGLREFKREMSGLTQELGSATSAEPPKKRPDAEPADRQAPLDPNFMIVAHRGFSAQYPENTLVAFRAALELGCGWIELDVRRTADGVLVVLHDDTVDRTTDGQGLIDEMEWRDVQTLDAGSWKDSSFIGERLPSLEQVLTLVGGRAQIAVEMKLPEEHAGEVVDLIAARNAIEWTVVTAFEWEALMAARENAPKQRFGWLTDLRHMSVAEAIQRCADAGIAQLCPHASATDRALVEAAHEAGLVVRCWGVGFDDGPRMRRLVGLGVDGMTTNHPDILMDIVREMKPSRA